MMKVAVTQRVEVVASYKERRDCLDQRWAALLAKVGALLLPLPNAAASEAAGLLVALDPDAVIFSGGNSLAALDPAAADAAPERDAFEAALLEQALARRLPILAVCRGMQAVNLFLGGGLVPVTGHAGCRHAISQTATPGPFPSEVNSYHNWGIAPEGLAEGLTPLAFDAEGRVEAFADPRRRLTGVMWHPERESPPHPLDLQLLEKLLS